MFDIGFSELVVIALVALLVLGPEKLPGAARTVGALVRRARQSWTSLQSELEREIGASEIKSSLEAARVTPDLSQIEGELRNTARAASDALGPDHPAPPAADAAPPAAPERNAPDQSRHE
jgi:sec-independent protein translocase protein TatB